MRKITKEFNYYWNRRINHKLSNTELRVINGVRELYLFGNMIARDEINGNGKPTGDIKWTMAGWNSVTTRERLTGVLGLQLKVKQGVPYVHVNGFGWFPIDEDKWCTLDENGLVII